MLRLGTVGTGWITQQLVEAAAMAGSFELAGVYSRRADKAQAFADKNHAERVVTDYQELLAIDGLNVVYLASPNSLHFDQALQAIRQDITVIVEKPAFSNPQEMAAIMAALADHPQAKLFEAARHVHTPNFHAVARALGGLPAVQGASLTYMKYSSRYDQVLAGGAPNVFTREFSGGALQDLGVYPVYLAVALFGVPAHVAYFPTLIQTGVDGKGVAVLRYGAYDVTVNFGKTSNSAAPSEIYGLKETIEMDSAGELTRVGLRQDGTELTDLSAQPLKNPMLPEVQDFARVLHAPAEKTNIADYHRWLHWTQQVNQVLYGLRVAGNLRFPADDHE
ncbi:dehydrogenase related protein [Levilactobacillus senmaizukei DSM 21775 = NBRC 103853]|uniref:Dehydrogenase related protein n=1 Tax=Levilactobacillus senmaizukei DSM 21775 = NBRC 103853 TaxID=1423803 RepID=A0A0R2DGA9_9LACO|nr:Gfo/Idh/MocA family oxidoreductase [Levilactobacillus senmaizukei]KRN03074.1 dehydrogenase related protein [Levilactobacillus senmaizukei DSM 21775 = NBRC 103853]